MHRVYSCKAAHGCGTVGEICPMMWPCLLNRGESVGSLNTGKMNAAQTSKKYFIAEEWLSSLLFGNNYLRWSDFSKRQELPEIPSWGSWDVHILKQRGCCWWPAFPAWTQVPIFSLHTELMCCSASLCAFVSLSLPLWCRQGIWDQLQLLCLSTESQLCHPAGKPVSCEHSIALLGITQSRVSTTGSGQPGLTWDRLSASTV